MKRRARASFMVLAILLAGCGGQRAESLPSLPSEPVEIMVDDAGIPHVYAANDQDLFFAYGYQLASDRLLQLAMFRRFAYGRLSEVLGEDGPGSAGSNSLIDDRFARIFNWKYWGQLDAALMREQDPEHDQLVRAWVTGINARIAEVKSGKVSLPFGFGPEGIDSQPESWDPVDPYVIQKMVGFGLDQTIEFEVFVTFANQFAPEALAAIELFKPAHDNFVLPPEERPASAESSWQGRESIAPPPASRDDSNLRQRFGQLGRLAHLKPLGSNSWAVDGRHSKNGRPLLAGDPHLGYAFSGITYALHLNSKDAGGSFNVTGFSFVGAPGVFGGHNDKVAWTPTSTFADVMDTWAVEVKDGKARIGDQYVEVIEREEYITMRGQDEAELLTVMDVPGYGVIMPSALVGSPLPIAGIGKEVLVGWTGFKARSAKYFLELNRVASADEFDAAVMRLPEMSYNFLAADASEIAYRVGVEVPERNALAPGREPFWTMDATDPQSFWTEERLSFDQLPHSRGGLQGWIATANNDPFGFTSDGRVDNDPWYYGGIFPPGWRAKRIEETIASLVDRGEVTIADMQALQMDSHSNLADDLLPIIVEVHAQLGTDAALAEFADRPELDRLVKLLTEEWDGEMKRESSGALAFHIFAHLLTAGVIEDDLSPVLYEVVLNSAPMYLLKIASLALQGSYPSGDAVLQGGRSRIVLEALSETAEFLEQRFGSVEPSNYRYRDMRVSSMDYAYGRPMSLFDVPTDGGESTVNVAQSKFSDGGEMLEQFASHWGPIERQTVNFDESGTPVSYVNFALGNVADPESVHFDDQMEAWVEGSYRKLLFERAEVEAATERTVILPAVR